MRLLDCIVADDEKLARDVLKNYIERVEGCRLVQMFRDGKTLLEYLKDNRVNVLFLDIQMPELNGLELIRSLDYRPSIILTTAYSEYAVEAFELLASDYLLKPFSFERFLRSIEKVRSLHSSPVPEEIKYIDLRVDRSNMRIPVDQICYAEAVGNYVKIYLEERFFITYGTIQKVKAMLPHSKFVQVHRSYVINVGRVARYTASSVTIGEKHIPVGRNFKRGFLLSNKAGE